MAEEDEEIIDAGDEFDFSKDPEIDLGDDLLVSEDSEIGMELNMIE
jgi:hypothetical protein